MASTAGDVKKEGMFVAVAATVPLGTNGSATVVARAAKAKVVVTVFDLGDSRIRWFGRLIRLHNSSIPIANIPAVNIAV